MTQSTRGRAVRAIAIVIAFLATAATSKRSPYYPEQGDSRHGSAYVHNATGGRISVSLSMMHDASYRDCPTLIAGDAAWITRGDFDLPEAWIARPAENLPLWDTAANAQVRECYAGYVAAGEKAWVIRWWHDRPAAHWYPHYAPRGEGLTDGALRLHGYGYQLTLVAPPGVSVSPMTQPTYDHSNDNKLSIATPPPGSVVAEAINGVSMASVGHLADPIGDSEWTFAVAARARGMWGRGLGYAFGTDFELGSTDTGGFLYDWSFYPVGVATETGVVTAGLVGGGGLGGITGDRAGFAWQLPVEAFITVAATRSVLLSAWGRSQWIFSEDARQNGSDSALFGDELRAGLSLEVLTGVSSTQPNTLSGFSISLMYGELLGTRTYGVGIGAATVTRPR